MSPSGKVDTHKRAERDAGAGEGPLRAPHFLTALRPARGHMAGTQVESSGRGHPPCYSPAKRAIFACIDGPFPVGTGTNGSPECSREDRAQSPDPYTGRCHGPRQKPRPPSRGRDVAHCLPFWVDRWAKAMYSYSSSDRKERTKNEYAPIAQLDRASVYGTEGQGFESLWAHK